MPAGSPPTICLAAFGTAEEAARQVYAHVENKLRQHFPQADFCWAFTSKKVREKIAAAGGEAFPLDGQFARLQAAGCRSVAVQSLHVAPGEMDERLRSTPASGLRVAFGQPLLASEADIKAVVPALAGELDQHHPNILIAHGNDSEARHNRMNLDFAHAFEEANPGSFVWSVEGEPGIHHLKEVRRLASQSGGVHFQPLMLVAGDHVCHDVMGDGQDSWKNLVLAPASSCGKPLGCISAIIDIFARHLSQALRSLEE